MNESNRVQNWRLNVLEQKKNEKSILLNCQMQGKWQNNGYGHPMNIRVMILKDGEYDTKCEWPHKNLTGRTVFVDGSFSIDEYSTSEKVSLKFCIFADKIIECDKSNKINRCINWNLRVFEIKKTNNGNIYYHCSRSGGRKKDGIGYKKSMPLSVFRSKDFYEWPGEDVISENIDVTGQFALSEYVMNDGAYCLSYGIFAESVKKHIWDSNH